MVDCCLKAVRDVPECSVMESSVVLGGLRVIGPSTGCEADV